MKNALVVGGNGFIGHHLVHALTEDGWQVAVYDRAVKGRFVGWSNPPQYIQGELGNRELVRASLQSIDTVFHLAYTTIPKTSNDDPAYDVQSNVTTTINLLSECVRAGVRRVVYLSSGGTVYGIPQQLPIREDHVTQPICSYGITKLMIEQYLFLFNHLYDLSYSVLRPANPYGEGQNVLGEQGAIAVFLGHIARGLPVEIWGDGSVTRDYFYVGDLARACIKAADVDERQVIANVGSGQGLSLNELLAVIRDTLDVEFDVLYKAGRPFDVPELILDIARARQVLGWEPQVTLEAGTQRTWEWITSQLNTSQASQDRRLQRAIELGSVLS